MRTRDEIERTAHMLGDERWQIWMECGVHNWQALPRIESGEPYWPNCCTIWTADGAIQKVPTKPISLREASMRPLIRTARA